MGGSGAVWLYFAWRFAFHYQEELLKPVSGRQAAYQHLFLAEHGHVGVVLTGVVGLISSLMAASAVWRAWTALPAAILGPHQLWLHQSFGRQPIGYTNIVGVRLDYIWNRKQIALIVDLEEPAARNRVAWAWFSSRYQVVVRDVILSDSLYSLARFRNQLAREAEAARARLSESSLR